MTEKGLDVEALISNRCWSRIGVWGSEKPRCPELGRVIHCQNCEVYASAGRGLLDREPSAGYRREWTEVLTKEKKQEETRTLSIVVFRIQEEWLGLSAKGFREIAEMREIRTLPHRTGRILKGVVNVRGSIHLCFSLAGLLGLDDVGPATTDELLEKPRLMVLERNRERWVFPADEVDGIHRFRPGELRDLPVTVSKDKAAFARGLFERAGRKIGYLDDELIVYALKKRVIGG